MGFFGTGGLPRPRYGFGMVDLGAVIKLRENHRGEYTMMSLAPIPPLPPPPALRARRSRARALRRAAGTPGARTSASPEKAAAGGSAGNPGGLGPGGASKWPRSLAPSPGILVLHIKLNVNVQM